MDGYDLGDIPVGELRHYGVKGMKWGVRKKRDSSGGSSSAKKDDKSTDEAAIAELYKKLPIKQRSSKEKVAAAAESQAKFLAKAGIDAEAEVAAQGGWRPTKKQVAYTLAGAAVVGLVVYSAYNMPKTPEAGMPCSLEDFKWGVVQSKSHSWISGPYVQPSSYDQVEFTLPKGHVFNRISRVAEDGFGSATYATSSTEDYNRYLSAFRGELGTDKLQHITFSAKEDIKVPSLVTRLETLREVMDGGKGLIEREDALQLYNQMSGGSWDSPTAKRFFAALDAKGYSAIIDDMDAGVIGEAPLVIFKPEKFTSKVAKAITPDDIKTAESSLIEITNRKLPPSMKDILEEAKKEFDPKP